MPASLLRPANLLEKDPDSGIFTYQICKILENNNIIEHLRTAVSDLENSNIIEHLRTAVSKCQPPTRTNSQSDISTISSTKSLSKTLDTTNPIS